MAALGARHSRWGYHCAVVLGSGLPRENQLLLLRAGGCHGMSFTWATAGAPDNRPLKCSQCGRWGPAGTRHPTLGKPPSQRGPHDP